MKLIRKRYIGKRGSFKFHFVSTTLLFILSIYSTNIFSNDRIKNSPSPYVAMHAEDAVEWFEWDKGVLARAKKENKPIYLTIGYFSCYWCHVLQRESFKNDVTAKIINDNFISVVVDRELHPVLDARLMAFAEKTIGRGGWPLNVIITPDGYPFMATIYLPEKKFQSWLTQVYGLWETDPEYIRTIAEDAANEMNFNFTLKRDELSSKQIEKITRAFYQEIMSAFDEMEGGFGDSAKFPLAAILQSAFDLYEKNPSETLKEHLLLTLKNMHERGLYDHLEGGFFRYTTDPNWQIPHFEKMLYDNAQLASLYLRAGKIFGKPNLTEVGKQALDFMLSHMQTPAGAFYGSFSAIDGKGVEGGYYVWDKSSWTKLLTKDENRVVSVAWDWSDSPIIDEGYLPIHPSDFKSIADQTKFPQKKIERLIRSAKNKLLVDRKKRKLPRDDKVLASWNALALIALIDGFETTGLQKYKESANKLANFITKELVSGDNLHRSKHKGMLAGNADLEDYALVALSLERWRKVSGDKSDSKQIDRLVKYAWSNFFSEKGWKMSDDLLIPYGAHESMLADGPLPSASGILIGLGLRSKDQLIKAKAILALQLGHGFLVSQPFWYASQVSLLMRYQQSH